MNAPDFVGQLQRVLERAGSALLELGPRLVMAFLLLLAGLAVASLVRYLTRRLVAGLDRLVPSRRLRRSLQTVAIGRPASEVLGTVVYWFVIVLFLAAATETVGLPLITTWLSGAARYLPSVVSALLIAFAGLAGGVFVRDLAASTAARAGLSNSGTLGRLLQTVVVLVSLLIAVDQLGVDTTLLTALIVTLLGVGLFGGALAFGLGARTEVSNILAAHYLQKTYRIGHRVRIGDHAGEIVQFTRTGVVLDAGTARITIPAKQFSDSASILVMEGSE